MEHHRGSTHHHNELHLWCYVHLRVVLLVQLFENTVIVILVLHHILRPTVELQVKGVEPLVQKLETSHARHQHALLETNGTLSLDGIRQALVLGTNLLNVAVARQTG